MRRRYVLILGCVFLLLCMTGCALQTKEKKLRDVEYTVVGAEDVPQELQEEINKIKDEERSEGTRLNSSHTVISYAVFCLKKKKNKKTNKKKNTTHTQTRD